MTHHTQDNQENRFPYVLVYSTLSAIITLASVWIATAISFNPTMVA